LDNVYNYVNYNGNINDLKTKITFKGSENSTSVNTFNSFANNSSEENEIIFNNNIKAKGFMDISIDSVNLIFSGYMTGISSFNMVNHSTLSAVIKADPVFIEAQELWIDKNSTLIIDISSINISGTFRYYDSFFHISGTNKGSSDYKTDITSPLEPRQKFSVGFYDYDTYLNPQWDAQNMNLSFVLDDGVLNEERAGIDAISIPLIIAAQNPIDDLIFGHKITKQNSSKKVRKNGKVIVNKNNETVIWAQPIYINASNSSGDNKWNMSSFIGALGIDIKVNENIVWGFGAEYEKPDYHSDNVDVTADGGNIFVYVMPQISKHFESGLFVLGGMNQYAQKREYNKTQYSSNFDSQRISGGVKLSFPFEIKTSAQIKPFIAYTKTYLNVSSHDEGEGVYALKYEYEEIVFDNLKIGTEIQKSVSRFITLNAKIFYSGIYGDKSAKADISFMDAQDIKEKMTGKEIDENYFGANIGLNFYLSKAFTFAPAITLTESQNQQTLQADFKFLLKF
jgi:hypothetical protein